MICKLGQDWIFKEKGSVKEIKPNQTSDHLLSFQNDSFVNLRAIDYNLQEVLKLVAWLAALIQAIQQTTT